MKKSKKINLKIPERQGRKEYSGREDWKTRRRVGGRSEDLEDFAAEIRRIKTKLPKKKKGRHVPVF
jgi:hypothetical protein